MLHPTRLAAVAGALILAPLAAADVLVVDAQGGPGSDFTDLQPAVDAALSGDLLLVRPGQYGAFAIDGKALTIVGDSVVPQEPIVAAARSTVRNLAAGVQVTLSGLELPFGLSLADCEGPVFAQDLELGAPESDPSTGEPLFHALLEARRCDALHLVDIALGGAATAEPPADPVGLAGAYFEDCTVDLWDSSFRGSLGVAGGDAVPALPPQVGGPGVHLVRTTLRGDQIEAVGGTGGDGSMVKLFACFDGGTGGVGLLIEGQECDVELRRPTLLGGAGGANPGWVCQGGDPGLPLVVEGGPFTLLGGEPRTLTTNAILRENGAATVAASSDPSDAGVPVYWLLGDAVNSLPFAPPTGTLIDASPAAVIFIGTAGPDGNVFFHPLVGDLPPGVESAQILQQIAWAHPDGTVALSEPAHTTIVDASF